VGGQICEFVLLYKPKIEERSFKVQTRKRQKEKENKKKVGFSFLFGGRECLCGTTTKERPYSHLHYE